MPNTAAEPMPDAVEPKQEPISRRIVRKRDSSRTYPAIPDGLPDTVSGETPGRPAVGPGAVLSEPAAAQPAAASAAERSRAGKPAPVAKRSVPDWPEWPERPDATTVPETPSATTVPEWPGATTKALGIDATAGTIGATNDDVSAQPSGTTDREVFAQPMPEAAAGLALDAVEPKRETMLRRMVRKRDSLGTHPAVPDEPTDAMGGEALEGSPVEAPTMVRSEPATAESAPASAAGLSGSAEPATPSEPGHALRACHDRRARRAREVRLDRLDRLARRAQAARRGCHGTRGRLDPGDDRRDERRRVCPAIRDDGSRRL